MTYTKQNMSSVRNDLPYRYSAGQWRWGTDQCMLLSDTGTEGFCSCYLPGVFALTTDMYNVNVSEIFICSISPHTTLKGVNTGTYMSVHSQHRHVTLTSVNTFSVCSTGTYSFNVHMREIYSCSSHYIRRLINVTVPSLHKQHSRECIFFLFALWPDTFVVKTLVKTIHAPSYYMQR